ncbi:MAG: hypothetical protein ACYTEZ_03850 [Planctomycetota bacterium]|jgi:hypothetical protein
MTPQIPVEGPSDRGSLVDQTVAYVRSNPLLRIAMVVTVLDHLGAMVLVVTGKMAGQAAGILALFSVLSWFFAVCMPVMNREVRVRMGGLAVSYWSQVLEMFFRVVLFGLTGLYTALLVYAAV